MESGENRRQVKVRLSVHRLRFGSFPLGLQAQPFFRPAADQPVHVLLDRLDVFHVLLGRIRVVHTQMANAAEFAGDAEVQADGLGVADVQVAVWLGRKARHDLLLLPALQIGGDDVADEVGGRGRWVRAGILCYGRCRHSLRRAP